MKTLLLTNVFPPQTGGSGRWLYEIYRRFPAGEVVVAAGEHPHADAFDRLQHFETVRLPLAFGTWGMASPRGLRGYWRALQAVRRILRATSKRPSAIVDPPSSPRTAHSRSSTRDSRSPRLHCGCMLPEGWIAWMLRRMGGPQYVCYVHGEELNVARSSRELLWMARRVLAGAGLVIANSRNTAGILADDWPIRPGRLRVLHPGVDASRFVPAERDECVRSELGWCGRTVLLTVGRLQERKGHDMLIRGLPEIVAAVPDVLYAIVGDGEQRGRLEALAAECGAADRVQFLGEPDDEQLIQCYQQCDLFALPNRTVNGDFEGFGMVLVEAQACGKPVLAGDSGGTVETMREEKADSPPLTIGGKPLATVQGSESEDGGWGRGDPHHASDVSTGVLVDCTGPEPLARAVIELLSDRERLAAMGAAGRQWVVERFDWEALSQQAHDLFGAATQDREEQRMARQRAAGTLHLQQSR